AFMGSLAMTLHAMDPAQRRVDELVALDAPWLTSAYDAVWRAASSVNRISNFYMPWQQSTETNIWGDEPWDYLHTARVFDSGFGMPILQEPTIVTNFELSHQLADELLPSSLIP